MAVAKKYCHDCGARLRYHADLSNPKAPNEYRNLIYECEACYRTDGKRKFISVKKTEADDSLLTMNISIIKDRKKYQS